MKSCIKNRKFITILCCILSSLLIAGLFYTCQQAHKTKYIMQCEYITSAAEDGTILFTLSDDRVLTVSIGTCVMKDSLQAQENCLKRNKVLKDIVKTSQKTLTGDEFAELEDLLIAEIQVYSQPILEQELTQSVSAEVYVIYKGKFLYIPVTTEPYCPFKHFAKKLQDLSPIPLLPVDLNLGY